jgi:hypothetical protein
MTVTSESPTSTTSSSDEIEIDHIYCCDCYPVPGTAETAICGTDIRGDRECPADCTEHPECRFCAYLLEFPCPVCGTP